MNGLTYVREPELTATRGTCPGFAIEPDASVSSAGVWLIAIGGLLGTVFLALQAGTTTLPIFLRDNQHYFFITERVAAGVPPHVSAFDPKNTLAILVSGAFVYLGDFVGVSPAMMVRIVSVAMLGLFNGLIGALAYRASRSFVVGALATALSLAYLNPLSMAAIGGRPKLLLMLLIVLTTWAVHRRSYPLAAVLAALCFLTWQPALLLLFLVFGVALFDRVERRTVGIAAVAALVPILSYQAYYWLTGGWDEQIFQSYTFPGTYMSHGVISPWTMIGSLAEVWRRGYGPNPTLAIALLAMVACWGRLALDVRSWRDWDPGWVFLNLAAAGTMAFTIYDHQGPPDLYLILPFLSIFAAIGLVEVSQRLAPRVPLRATQAIGAVLVLVLLAWATRWHRLRSEPGWSLADQQAAAAIVDGWMEGGETVYAVNSAHLLGMARRDNWTRFSSFFRGVNRYLESLTDEPAFVPRNADGDLPDRILLGQGRPFGWPEWLEGAYEDVTTREFEIQNITVWRRAEGR